MQSIDMLSTEGKEPIMEINVHQARMTGSINGGVKHEITTASTDV
jgi:hypothetical protein